MTLLGASRSYSALHMCLSAAQLWIIRPSASQSGLPPDNIVPNQAFGPPGGLPIETQENTGFIKKVAEKLHIRNKESDHHPRHRRTEARACEGSRALPGTVPDTPVGYATVCI